MLAWMQGKVGGALRSWVLCGAALAVMMAAGCGSLLTLGHDSKPPTGHVCHIATSWDNCLAVVSDSANGGAPLRGLKGRLYLFDNEAKTPIACEGELWVDLYDDRPIAAGGVPKRLERWQFPKEIMAQLLRKDLIGWGYTIFLPWVHSYRPDITAVHFQICFQPRNAVAPLYDNTERMTINHGERPAVITSFRQEIPGR
jgi:hypothetical protein